MRWIWIDKFTRFDSRTRATAVKAVTLAEEQLHDQFPRYPFFPHSLIIEGVAQTAGMLVGEARQFKEKVILAKIGRATFHALVLPGSVMTFDTSVTQLNDSGASIEATVTVDELLVAEIELMFSHIDQNLGGQKFPEHNFVFTTGFRRLLDDFRLGQQQFPLNR